MNTLLSARLQDAMSLAAVVHGEQKRKGDGMPYITHPMAVFALLASWGASEDVMIAGLLHDAIEDSPTPVAKAKVRDGIERISGVRVLSLIDDVTEKDKELPWKERKQQYLNHLEEAPRESVLVSCADKTHNTFCLFAGAALEGKHFWKRFNAPKEEKLWFYHQVHSICQQRLHPLEVREFTVYLEALTNWC